jgi:hypothetical protein
LEFIWNLVLAICCLRPTSLIPRPSAAFVHLPLFRSSALRNVRSSALRLFVPRPSSLFPRLRLQPQAKRSSIGLRPLACEISARKKRSVFHRARPSKLGLELRHRRQDRQLQGTFGLLGRFYAVIQVLHEKGQPQSPKGPQEDAQHQIEQFLGADWFGRSRWPVRGD